MIYLDNSATTKPCEAAVEAMTTALTEQWANPSALYGFGFNAAKALRTARNQVAKALGAEPDRVFFTSGGTEADNWALFGTAKRFGKKHKHIISTAVEHHAILNVLKELHWDDDLSKKKAGLTVKLRTDNGQEIALPYMWEWTADVYGDYAFTLTGSAAWGYTLTPDGVECSVTRMEDAHE